MSDNKKHTGNPTLLESLIPLAFLVIGLISILLISGPDNIQTQSQPLLLGAGIIALAIARLKGRNLGRALKVAAARSATQGLPVILILFLIGTVSATWMYSGAVPTLICYGIDILNPHIFLVASCAICSMISVLSGSSWSTIATIGVAFMGIGTMLGFHPGWTAGAIISGAYFGDKISPLSDTTVLASSSCGVGLFDHIRYMMITTVPAMTLALAAYTIAGWTSAESTVIQESALTANLHETFNITPLTLFIPLATIVVLSLRVNTIITLILSTLFGIIGIFLFQPQVLATLEGTSSPELIDHVSATINILATETTIATGSSILDDLVTTGGMAGMTPTIYLVVSALFFGTSMMASGMLYIITHSISNRLHRRQSIIPSTVLTGIALNSSTGDQYLSIILSGHLYKNLYRRCGLEERLLSRTIEDSTSVTSVLIPWNSCGLTQSAVLGVATMTYLPFCIFNLASPLMTLIMAWTGFKVYPANRTEALA